MYSRQILERIFHIQNMFWAVVASESNDVPCQPSLVCGIRHFTAPYWWVCVGGLLDPQPFPHA